MSAFDDALARLLAFAQQEVSGLNTAQQTILDQKAQIDSLIANDATQDQIDIAEAVKTALDNAAAQINTATDNLQNPPPVVTDPPVDPPVVADPGLPGPPNDPPAADTPVDETPVVTPVDPPVVVENPVPVDPGTDPVPAGDLPADTPVVEAPNGPVTEVPAEAPVVVAGDLPTDAPVVPVTEDPAAGTGQ